MAAGCPKGRPAEDGAIPARYQLQEKAGRKYPPREKRNVEDSDATLIIVGESSISRRWKLTIDLAERAGKLVHVVVSCGFERPAPEQIEWVRSWLQEVRRAVLNVAGSHASKNPNLHGFVIALLEATVSKKD